MTSETEKKVRTTNQRDTKHQAHHSPKCDKNEKQVNNNKKNHDLQMQVFCTMFACSLLLDLVEDWIDPALNNTALVLFYGFVLSTDSQKCWTYPLFLMVVMAYHLFIDFPGVPNHINVAIIICLQQLLVVLYLWWNKKNDPSLFH